MPAAHENVLERLREIDPAFLGPPINRFGSVIARGVEAAAELETFLGDDDPDVRADAAEAIGVLGADNSLEALRECLTDPDGEVRTAAAVAVIRIGDQLLFPEVVKSLRHQDPRVVIGAAVALGRLKDLRVVPNLIQAFMTENAEVGAALAWALGQCGDKACLPWLMTAVEQDFVVANACEALGQIGDSRAEATLLEALKHKSEGSRAAAARALGLLSYVSPASSRAKEPLRALLEDQSTKVRLCAAVALFELGDQEGGEALVKELSR